MATSGLKGTRLRPLRLSKKLFRRIRRRQNLAIDEHAPGIGAPRLAEFPGDLVALSGQLRPRGSFGGVLFEPEMAIFVREAPQLRTSEPIGPGLHVR